MNQERPDEPTPTVRRARASKPFPAARAAIAGVLMGLANLVPGISGGTMILVMGLYDDFITAVADLSRLRFARRNVALLAVIVAAAGLSIATLAGTLSRAVTLHQSAMFSLFIGLTLGGAPALARMLKRITPPSAIGMALGLGVMILIAVTHEQPPDRAAMREAVAAGQFVVHPAYARDVVAGILGMSAMILPGISGAYMLLVLHRYETILAAISLTKRYALSFGDGSDPAVFLRVLVPTAIGALLSLVVLSNFLKWMLRRHDKFTVGALLGILLGSVIGIWPFTSVSQPGEYVVGALLAAAGFAATLTLSRIGA